VDESNASQAAGPNFGGVQGPRFVVPQGGEAGDDRRRPGKAQSYRLAAISGMVEPSPGEADVACSWLLFHYAYRGTASLPPANTSLTLLGLTAELGLASAPFAMQIGESSMQIGIIKNVSC
jgi:hypothetical protein